MVNILYQLFNGDYDITPKPSKKQHEIRDQLFAELDQVRKELGAAFHDRLLDLDTQRLNLENFQYYRSGLVLGICLMLEALNAKSD